MRTSYFSTHSNDIKSAEDAVAGRLDDTDEWFSNNDGDCIAGGVVGNEESRAFKTGEDDRGGATGFDLGLRGIDKIDEVGNAVDNENVGIKRIEYDVLL